MITLLFGLTQKEKFITIFKELCAISDNASSSEVEDSNDIINIIDNAFNLIDDVCHLV